jgi:hypothetical protein
MQIIIRPIQIQTNKLERLQMVLTPKTGSLISIGNCSPDMYQWCQWSARYQFRYIGRGRPSDASDT